MLAVADNYNSPLQVDRQGTSVTGHFQYMGYSGRRVKASAYPVSIKQGGEVNGLRRLVIAEQSVFDNIIPYRIVGMSSDPSCRYATVALVGISQ